MKNQRIVKEIVNQLLHSEEMNIENEIPPHVQDQLPVNSNEILDQLPISVSDQLTRCNETNGGEFNIPVKKAVRHLHYKTKMNSSKNKIYFSVFFAFHRRQNVGKINNLIVQKKRELKTMNFPTIQDIFLCKNTGNLCITQAISVEKTTKKELNEKISLLLQGIEAGWPFKY